MTDTIKSRAVEAMARAKCKRLDCEWDNVHPMLRKQLTEEAAEDLSVLRAFAAAQGLRMGVPVEPDTGMMRAIRRLDYGTAHDVDWPEGWNAMLDAAPDPFAEPEA